MAYNELPLGGSMRVYRVYSLGAELIVLSDCVLDENTTTLFVRLSIGHAADHW